MLSNTSSLYIFMLYSLYVTLLTSTVFWRSSPVTKGSETLNLNNKLSKERSDLVEISQAFRISNFTYKRGKRFSPLHLQKNNLHCSFQFAHHFQQNCASLSDSYVYPYRRPGVGNPWHACRLCHARGFFFGFVSRDDLAVYALCCQNVVCRTTSIKQHFETKHEKSFKDEAEKIESLKKAISRYE